MEKKLTSRRKQALKTRKKILLCALDLFEKKGYDEVTMVEIAEAAQTSVGWIYRYFKSKDEIAAQNAEPLDDLYREYFAELTASEEYASLSALEKLERYYLFIQRVVSGYSNLRSLYIYNLKHPETTTFLTDQNREIYQDYKTLIDACRKEGSIRSDLSDEAYFDLFLQSSRGMLIDWLLRNENFDFEAQARKAWNVILSYIKTDL